MAVVAAVGGTATTLAMVGGMEVAAGLAVVGVLHALRGLDGTTVMSPAVTQGAHHPG